MSQDPVEVAVNRWNSRLEEHRNNLLYEEKQKLQQQQQHSQAAEQTGPSAPPPMQKRDAPSGVRVDKKKLLTPRRHDSETTKFCLGVANQYIEQSRGEVGVVAAPTLFNDEPLAQPALSGPVFSMYSNSRPMRDFGPEWQRRQYEQLTARHQTILLEEEVERRPVIMTEKPILPLEFLKGQNMPEKMKSLFTAGLRFYNAKITEGQPEPLDMPTDSAHHIAKLLVLHDPERPFQACVNANWGICQATSTLVHPFRAGALIAYYSVADYLKVCRGEPLPANLTNSGQDEQMMTYQNLCEFCYRAFVSDQVQDSKYHKHRAVSEIPCRYYQTGFGEYSKDGMYQQAHISKANFSHGIIGTMRLWSTKDFVPCMLEFNRDNTQILECIHYDDYEERRRTGRLNGRHWIPGWREIGPFYAENENSMRSVKQTKPYIAAFSTTLQEPCVGTLLIDYFDRERRRNNSELWDYAHLFRDLYECWQDADYLARPHYRSKQDRWKFFCVHQYESPPPVDTHKLYYVVLMKVNTLRKLISPKSRLNLTKLIQQKIQVYLSSYHPLLAFLQSTQDYSDAALLSNTQEMPRLGIRSSVLMEVYPLPIHHHRNGDQQYYRLAAHRYARNNPLQACQKFYCHPENDTLPPLFDLPYNYNASEGFEELVDEIGATAALENQEDALQALKACFSHNVLAIHTYGVQFRWKESAAKKQRKPGPKEGPLDMAQAEKKKQRQRKAAIRALSSMNETARQNFAQLDDWVAGRTGRYLHLLKRYTEVVLVDFSEAVQRVRGWRPAELGATLQDLGQFASLIPQQIQGRVSFSAQGVNSVNVNNAPWAEHCILLALLVRVAVLEELHALEPYSRNELRHNLVLLRNSHLKLFRKIFENPAMPARDDQLLKPFHPSVRLTVLDYYYPHPERELHEGCLPDYVNGHEMVNYFADGGMDNWPWSKLQYKMPDRCCDVREYSMMLRNFCQDSTFYRWTLLALRLSLCGLYTKCTVVPSFARTVSLDELFDQSLHENMKPTILQFILNNESLVLNAISESLCYQLELMPSLLKMLDLLYRDWFSWRVRANLDMTRYLYSAEGTFQSVQEVVFERVHLKSMRTLFRLNEVDFVVWVCGVFKKADDNRHKTPKPRLPREAAVSPIIDTVIQNLILQLDPNQTLDVRVLRLIGIEEEQLHVLHSLYKAFCAQIMQNMDQPLPPELEKFALNTKQLVEIVHAIVPQQYIVMCHFFTLLRNYQSVRVLKIRNAGLLARQWQRIQQRTGAASLDEVPRFAFCCAFSFCCKHVKNSWSSKPGTLSTGFEDIFYDLENDIYVCAKKIHQPLDEDELADEKTITAKRKSDRELRRPVCVRTEPFTVFLPGFLAEADSFKIPGTKRVTLNETENNNSNKGAAANANNKKAANNNSGKQANANKKQVFDLPLPGYWITPCCGIPFEYDFDRWTPAGYQCRFCPSGIALYNSFNEVSCIACRLKVTRYHLLKIYDDVHELQMRTVLFCTQCHTAARYLVKQYPLLSLLLKGIQSMDSLAGILNVAT